VIEVVRVLCVDDRDDGATFDRHFARDLESRRRYEGHEPRRLVRYGPVVASDRAAHAPLLRSIKDEAIPDIVLIDHVLEGHERSRYAERGLDLMNWIREQFDAAGVARPACVLCTARFTPGLAHTFVRCGGTQAIDRTASWPDQIDRIWQGYDWHVSGHGHWTHAPRDGYPLLELAPSCAALLPYLEADMPTASIAAALAIKPATVHDRRSALVEAINAQLPARLLPDGLAVVTNGRSSSLARIASDCGLVWVPLALASYVPAGP
jgi:hypothetical protein